MLARRGLVVLPLALLAACGASARDYAPSVAGPTAGLTAGLRGPLAGQPAVRALSGRAPGQARHAAPVEEAPAARGGAPQSARAEDRFIVRSAYLRLARKDVESGPKEVGEIAKRFGGWVQRTDNSSATILVPAERLDQVLEEIQRLGEVQKKDVRGEDVTEEYLNLRIRLDNLEKARARYIELLARAQTVAETLGVERELERVTLEIERFKGRLQYLERVVRFSTVVASFERPTSPGPVGWIFYLLFEGVKWLFVWD